MNRICSVTGIPRLHIQFLFPGNNLPVPDLFFPVILLNLPDCHGNAGQRAAKGGSNILRDLLCSLFLLLFCPSGLAVNLHMRHDSILLLFVQLVIIIHASGSSVHRSRIKSTPHHGVLICDVVYGFSRDPSSADR